VLEPQQGKITLSNGVAMLQVPKSFYYLSPSDAEKVLVEAWGNPPGKPVLGMLFPVEVTPLDSSAWGVTIEYRQDGHVSDKGADDIDYEHLLARMQAAASTASEHRVRSGYEPIELVGWVAEPYYDSKTHKLHWAQELKFGSNEVNTVNYNIRVLGRKGVLWLNFVANMDQFGAIKSSVDDVLSIAEFNKGYRYEDFRAETDEVAGYGIETLVAGNLFTATGVFAAALFWLKKFWIALSIAAAALLVWLFRYTMKNYSANRHSTEAA
jgi:uncharacterized membrane-anchored protein